jgi:putative phosphoribosyl transferase
MPETWLRNTVVEEMAALRRREQVYRQGRLPIDVVGRSAILVDDFLGNGHKESVAIWALRQRHPAEIILAAPFCSGSARAKLAALVDRLVVLRSIDGESPTDSDYAESSTTDAQVLEALRPPTVARSLS